MIRRKADGDCCCAFCGVELSGIRSLDNPQPRGKGVFMTRECKMINLCGFLQKHGNTNEVAGLWFRQEYCTGLKQDECKRKEYMIEHGKVPMDDMSPTGEVLQPVTSV
jgi:hypothetical protein